MPQVPLALYIPLQALLVYSFNSDPGPAAECALEGLSHTLSQQRISAFHQGMRSLASIVAPGVRLLQPPAACG